MLQTYKLANEIKEVAFDLEKEAADVKKMPIYLPSKQPSEKNEQHNSSDISKYRSFIQKLDQKRTDPENAPAIRYLNFFSILLTEENLNKSHIERNVLASKIQAQIDSQKTQEDKTEKAVSANWSASKIENEVKRILNKYKDNYASHPTVILLKEILNYGVVYGPTQFIKLFTMPNKFRMTFNVQIEKRKIKQEEKQNKLPAQESKP